MLSIKPFAAVGCLAVSLSLCGRAGAQSSSSATSRPVLAVTGTPVSITAQGPSASASRLHGPPAFLSSVRLLQAEIARRKAAAHAREIAEARQEATERREKQGRQAKAMDADTPGVLSREAREREHEREAHLELAESKTPRFNVHASLSSKKMTARKLALAKAAAREKSRLASLKARGIRPQKAEEENEEAGTDYLEAYLYYLKQRAYPNDHIDWNDYTRAEQHRDQMPAAQLGQKRHGIGIQSVGGRDKWQFIGPNNTPVPYQVYYGRGVVAGRVNAMAYAPGIETTYYAATAGGGVWRTDDGGQVWKPLSQGWPELQTSSIAIDPTDANTLYVGTGDFDGFTGNGYGIMKSTDGGQTWTNLGRGQLSGNQVSAIAIDPDNPSTLTVTLGRGANNFGQVWRSTDGGTTWNRVISVSAVWSGLSYGAKQSNGTRNLYAVAGDPFQVQISKDSGATWTALTPPSTASQSIVRVAASLTFPNTVYLIASDDQKLWKSLNGGTTWTDITSANLSNSNWSQSFYDMHIECGSRTIAGTTTDLVYVGLIDLLQSQDGGASFRSVGGPTYTGSSILHNDQHTLAVNPSNPRECIVGCDGGVYRLLFDNLNQPTMESLNHGLGITQFYGSDYHPTDPTYVVGGAQDNASPIANGDLNYWLNFGGGDGGYCAINPRNPNIQYLTSQFLSVYRTPNAWSSEQYISPNIMAGDFVPFIAPVAINKKNPRFFYGGTNYLYQWDDNAFAWTAHLGAQQLSNEVIRVIETAPSDEQRIYTGGTDGQLWMSQDRGASWTEIDGGSPNLPGRTITSISVDSSDPNKVLVGFSGTGGGHLFKTDDTTANPVVWTDISGNGNVNTNLPNISLNGVARDLDDPTQTFYAATDVGVFATRDGGQTWANATEPLGLPNVQVNDIKMVTGTRFLQVSTYGRGMWRIQLDDRPNLWWQNNIQSKLAAWYLDGAVPVGANYVTTGPLPSRSQVVATPDFNRDGKPDLLWQNTQTGAVFIWTMNGITPTGTLNIAGTRPLAWRAIGMADINGDGNPDLVWQNTQTGAVDVWYLGGNDGTVHNGGTTITDGFGPDWQVSALVDLNLDGKTDLLWHNNTTGDVVVWYLNKAVPQSALQLASGVSLDWNIVAVTDSNADGIPDLIWQHTGDGAVIVWYMAKNGPVSADLVQSSSEAGWRIVGPR